MKRSAPQAAPQAKPDTERGASFSKASDYLAVYVVYVFISGWGYGASYLQALGISQRWFDLSLSDELVRGFTVLFSGGKWLLPFYLLVLLIPIVAEIPSWENRALIRILSVVVMVALLWPIFLVSRDAGYRQGKIDITPQSSRLQTISFSTKEGKKYVGKLVYLRDGLYFMREVSAIGPSDEEGDSSAGIELPIYRTEDLQNVKVVGIP